MDFEHTGTGGGCEALCAIDAAGYEFLITDGNLGAPQKFSAPCILSISDPEGYALKALDCPNVATAKVTADKWSNEYRKQGGK